MNRFETADRRRALSRWLVVWLLLTLGLPAAPAETNTVSKVPSNRWLIIVQTTSSMASRASQTANLAAMLVVTGMSGQMVAGDTLGLWTYDDAVHTGVFPLQMWTPSARKAIADRVYDFINTQKFEKEGHLNYVLFDAQKVVKNSDFITLVLITDGMDELHGTPFDEKVNSVYATWKKDQANAHIPFITVLRAEHGQLTNSAVTVSPWPLELPPPSPQLVALRNPKAPPKPTVVTVTNPPVILPPLIVSGKKPETAPPPAPAPQATVTNMGAVTVSAAAPPSGPQSEAAPGAVAPKPLRIPPAPAVAAVATNAAPGGETINPPATPVAAGGTAVAAQPSPPKPEPAPTPVVAARSEPVPAAPPPAPVPSEGTVTIGDLFTRRNGWIIPLGIAGLVIASFTLGMVFAMFRRMRNPQRISLVTPKPEQDKGEKVQKI